MNLFRRNDCVRKIKTETKIVASHIEHPKWQLITLMEEWSGFSSFSSELKQYFLLIFHLFMEFCISSAVMNKSREFVTANDTDMVIECYLTMTLFFTLTIKIILGFIFKFSRLKIYQRIADHFKTITDPEEAKVLEKSADQGFKYTATYLVIMCICCVVCDCVPFLRTFYNYFFVHGELIWQLPLQFDFGFDQIKYWYIVTLIFGIWVCSGLYVDAVYDLSYILQIHHVQGLFKIIGMRLNKVSELTNEFENETMTDDVADETYRIISSAIDLHAECFKIVKMIEKVYTITWFIILMVNSAIFGACVHLITVRWHDSIETFRNFFVFLLVIMHFFVIFHQGQKMIDSGDSISYICYNCKWYGLPKKSCKLLSMMMIRCSIPCEITGAKLFPLSLETFGKMLKAGISYYTVFKT